MEDANGIGSYIWGRSVHNTRIERLWFDVTQGFGKKWKQFFILLETNHRLDPERNEHIWLLHHLFLDAINQDALDWAEAWNSHTLEIQGGRNRSPRDIFFFDMLQLGPRGLHAIEPQTEEIIENLDAYGIDWEVLDDRRIMEHFHANNPHNDSNVTASFTPTEAPPTMSHVQVDSPGCPFTADQVAYMDYRLSQLIDCTSRHMDVRRLVWENALAICEEMAA
ncbi:hypothetical protein BD410DRAFT_816580 [Rickenella mellea]|uniref:Integrase core domain-containing protein n=1 Tax=Rickenella mellea TaxID=50990 RepID=A0A4Y7PPK0_9AGAM|nr:hypothetical protein BD410DRAFT_816580 [Rickenella mellea]